MATNIPVEGSHGHHHTRSHDIGCFPLRDSRLPMKYLSLPRRQPWIRRRTPDLLAVNAQKSAVVPQVEAKSQEDGFTYSDTVPVLVDHHDAQEHAKREEKEAVDIVLDGVADRHAESEQDDLSDSEKRGSEHDIADGPTVFERPEHEQKLRHDIDHGADQRPQDVDDPQGDGLSIGESDKLLESGDGKEESGAKYRQARDPQELGW
jgi:hypothetical protein